MAKPKIYQVDQLQTMVGSMNTAITAAHNQANSAYGAANTGGGPKIASIVYPGNDTAANNIGGQTIYLTGSGFYSNSSIYINGNSVPATSFISASNIGFTTPNLTNGIYPIYLVNYDGATAIKVPGIVISGEPSWSTAAGSLSSSQAADGAWSYSLSATGDAPITYALAAGSTLPTGVSLNANGVISGTISSPPVVDTTYTFSVVATDAQNQDATRQFSVTASVGEGALFANNVLLLHADGTNNGNNHAFLDSSNNNFSITRYGNATQGTFSPFSQTGWSNYFDGNGDYFSIAGNSIMDFGSGNWTVEAWVNLNAMPTSDAWPTNYSSHFVLATAGTASLGDGIGCLIGQTKLLVQSNDTQYASTSHGMTTNVWYHIAFVRSGNTIYFFVNGVAKGTVSFTGSVGTGGTTWIGTETGQGAYFNGYISNLRINKGSALYTSAFTPSTTPLTAIANTYLLTCQSNRFIDNSANSFTLTRNGEVSIQAFSPFTSVAYSSASIGGSLYLDGSGDYLTLPTSSAFAPGTGDYTIEAWVYPTTTNGDQFIWAQTVYGQNYFIFAHSGTTAGITSGSGGGTFIGGPANSIKPYAWNHIAAVRISGTLTVYVNGVGGTPTSHTNNFTDTTIVPTIGRYTHDSFGSFTGYISSLRYVKGTGVYTANFTPPTGPLTNIANTSALLNFTNAQIFDQTAKNVLECIGDAKVSTSVYKYGSGSIYLDGTGDWLLTRASPNLDMGAGNLTIEGWFYLTATVAVDYRMILSDATNGYNYVCIRSGGTGGQVEVNVNGTSFRFDLNNSVTINTWFHLAIVRSGNTWYGFVNGTSIGSTTNSGSFNIGNGGMYVGRFGGATAYEWPGYIDDLRITRGYARYTSNFTAPAAAFPNK